MGLYDDVFRENFPGWKSLPLKSDVGWQRSPIGRAAKHHSGALLLIACSFDFHLFRGLLIYRVGHRNAKIHHILIGVADLAQSALLFQSLFNDKALEN